MRLLHFWHIQLAHCSAKRRRLTRFFAALTITLAAVSLPAKTLLAGAYSSSAHGNSSYGVNRSSTATLGYVRSNCAHCHELKGSIIGTEPAPVAVGGAPSPSALFYDNNVSQTDNVCLQCHTGAGSYQSGALVNRRYSYRAGAWTSDLVDDVKESFAFLSPGSSHNLNDILTFIQTQLWGYKSTSNPCAACHNPHAAQGDPGDSTLYGNSTKSSATKGYPISLPSLHTAASGSWGLWGDTAVETMSTYTTYQAPLRVGVAALEPRGDEVSVAGKAAAALNTTDYVVFCTNCHNATNTIYSTTLARNLKTIDWNTEKHGQGVATPSGNPDGLNDLLPPYSDASLGAYVLSCLDCHEPHGSTNAYLLRPEVNGTAPVTVTALAGADTAPDGPTGGTPNPLPCNKEWVYLCSKCHNRLGPGNDGYHLHQQTGGGGGCGGCHPATGCYFIPCGKCHFHGFNF